MITCYVYDEASPNDRPLELHTAVFSEHAQRCAGNMLVVVSTIAQKDRWLEAAQFLGLDDRLCCWSGNRAPLRQPGVVVVCKTSLNRFFQQQPDLPQFDALVLDNVSLLLQYFAGFNKPRRLTDVNASLLRQHLRPSTVYLLHTPHTALAPTNVGDEQKRFAVLSHTVRTLVADAADLAVFFFRLQHGSWELVQELTEHVRPVSPSAALADNVLEVQCLPLHRSLAEWYGEEIGGDDVDVSYIRMGFNPPTCKLHPSVDPETWSVLSSVDLNCNFSRLPACYIKATALAEELCRSAADDIPLFMTHVPDPHNNFQLTSTSARQLLVRLRYTPNSSSSLEQLARTLSLQSEEVCAVCCDHALETDTLTPSIVLSCGHCFCLFCSIRLCANVIVWQNHFLEGIMDEGRLLYRLGAVQCPMCRANASLFHPLLAPATARLRQQTDDCIADTFVRTVCEVLPSQMGDRQWLLVVPCELLVEMDILFGQKTSVAWMGYDSWRVAANVTLVRFEAVVVNFHFLANEQLLVLNHGHRQILWDMRGVADGAAGVGIWLVAPRVDGSGG